MDHLSGKQNIAMLGHKRIPSREGGVEIVVEQLCTRMVRQGHRVTCFNRSGHHVSGAVCDTRMGKTYQGIRLRTVPTIHRKGLAAVSSSFFGAVLSALGRYDIVHFHAEGPCAMLWIPKLFGKRCIATIHGLDWQREKWHHGFAARYIRFGEKVAANYADEIIVLSRNVQAYFLQTYHREPLLIPNGVTAPVHRQADRIVRDFGLEKDGYLLFLGRIVPEKGLRCLINAFRKTATEKKLVIAGGTSDTEDFGAELQALARGDDRILFTGFVEGPHLEELYSNAYVYLLPSDLEGMPLSLLEAMSYGNCCLVSDIPECTEVVEDKAVTFRRGEPEDLRRKLELLCTDPALVHAYRAQAADYICRKYNWNTIVTQTLEAYGKPT